ncbi:MAG: thiamine diphosphokinase [Butyrivibrio sp.]|nr:thiamine diphosphokinase [Butyrivibrio sp.]
MKKCIIVGGGPISDYKFVKERLPQESFVIYCDSGLYHEEKLELAPDLIIGDFDSHPNPNRKEETIVLPKEKDDTDTIYAVKEAIKRGFTDFTIVGALGRRFDHSLGNLAILLMLEKQGISGKIIDDYSEIMLISGEQKEDEGKISGSPLEINDDCKYFSVLCAGERAEGVTIKGAKYEVEKVTLTADYPLGVSNEVPKGQTARVSVEKGKLFIIKVISED